MTNKDKLIGYSNFDEIEDVGIKAWNRANTIYNIKERFGDEVATKYVSQFDKHDMALVYMLMLKVASNGYENVRREVFREVVNA